MNGTEPRLKVLVVDLSKRHGGADVRVRQIVTLLGDRCDIAVAALAGSPIATDLEALGATVLSIRRSRHDPRIVGDLMRIARRFRPDVVDAHNPQSQLWALLAAAGLGLKGRLATVHSSYGAAHPGRFKPLAHEACLHLARALGAHFLAVSQSVRGYVESFGVPPARIHLSLNGIEPLPGPVQGAGMRAALGLAADVLLVGIVGRIDPIKGHDVLIRAAERLCRRGHAIHVLVVGEGDFQAPLVRQVADLGMTAHVDFTGFRRDVPAILADLDVLCIPSRSEGLPYAVLEAARQGVPIVASAADGLRAILDDGTTALIVPIDDADALARALLRLRDEPALRSRLGAAATAMVAARYSVDRMAAETLAVYRAVAAAPRASRPAALGSPSGGYGPKQPRNPGEPGF